MAGVPVSSLEEIPMELVGKTLPATEYGIFTHKGPIVGKSGAVKDTHAYAYGTWLPKSPYVNPYAYDFELYGERYKGNTDPVSETDICIPIRKR